MAVGIRGGLSESETALLEDVVRDSVDFKGLPASRSKSGCWKSASFIIGVEVVERFAYYGISSNLISYLTGPLGQSTAAAAANVNVWNGAAQLLPLCRRFYRRLLSRPGLGFMSLSANSSVCKNYKNLGCSPPSLKVLFFISLYLVAFAQGGNKPCLQVFGADQFDEEDENELKSKNSFFNWWYFSMNIGILVAISVVSYIQENLSWELGFGIPCIAMCFGLIIFLLGSTTYRFRINSDVRNPFVIIGKVFISAAKNWDAIGREDQGIFPHEVALTEQFFYQMVQMSKRTSAPSVTWRTPKHPSLQSTLFTKQGATMDRQITPGFVIPAASLQSLISVGIILCVPIYDRVFVPIARGITKKPAGLSMLQRIGTGIFLSVLMMVITALVERRRLATALEHCLVGDPNATVPMSVWWLAPQYLILGMADVFSMIGLQEFFYDQVPTELKSLGLALYLIIFGIWSFLSGLLISIIDKAMSNGGGDSWFSNNLNRAHLDYFYWLLGGLSTLTLAAYVWFARSYTYMRKHNDPIHV